MSVHKPFSRYTAETNFSAGPVSSAEMTTAIGYNILPRLRYLLAHAHRVSYHPHDALYHQGDVADTVLFITSGFLKLVSHLPNGRVRIVRLHRSGSILGLGGLFRKNHKQTAVAITPVTALCLPVSALRRLRTDDPTTYARLVESWHDDLQQADMWITQFSTGPIRGRVARLLVFLDEFEPEFADGQVRLLTCEEMGSILGVTSESVSRTLAEFKRRHLLVFAQRDDASKEIYNADMTSLCKIADE